MLSFPRLIAAQAFGPILACIVFWGPPAHAQSSAASDTDADSGSLPAHLQAVQRQLGGSAVDQFDALRAVAPEAPAWWRQFRGSRDAPPGERLGAPMGSFGTPTWGATWSGALNSTTGSDVVPADVQAPTGRTYALPNNSVSVQPLGSAPASVVAALREVAARLDAEANRLERVEIYEHADALREQARGLRMDARRRSAAVGTTTPMAPMPAVPPTPGSPAAPPFTPTSSAPPRTGATGTWHLHWVGPAPSHAQEPLPGPEPAAAPVWSEDHDSSDAPRATRVRRREPGAVPR